MDLIIDISINAAFAILPVLCSILIRRILLSMKKKKLKALMRLDTDDDLTLHCFTANPQRPDEEELVDLGYTFEYMAIGEITPALRKLYKDFDLHIRMSNESYIFDAQGNVSPKHYVCQNLLLIGGPFHNAITRGLLFGNLINLPFSFDNDANLIYNDGKTTKMYCPTISQGDKYVENDYAVIINIRNPLQKDKRIIAIIGCRSVGCYGGALYFANHLNELKAANDDEYALIINCVGDKERVLNDPVFVDYYKLECTPPTVARKNSKAA